MYDVSILKLTSKAAEAVNMIAKYAPKLLFREVDCRRHGLQSASTSLMHVLCAANSHGKYLCSTTPAACLEAARRAFDAVRKEEQNTTVRKAEPQNTEQQEEEAGEKLVPSASFEQLRRFSIWGMLALWSRQEAANAGCAAWRHYVFHDLVLQTPRALVDSGVPEAAFVQQCAQDAASKIADATRCVRAHVRVIKAAR